MLVLHALQSRNFSTPKVSFLTIKTEKLGATESCLSLVGHQEYDSLMLSESTIIYYHFTHIMNSANNYFLSETIPSFHLLHKVLRPYPQSVYWLSILTLNVWMTKYQFSLCITEKSCFNGPPISSHKDILFI